MLSWKIWNRGSKVAVEYKRKGFRVPATTPPSLPTPPKTSQSITREEIMDQFRFLGNCPPTPPLAQHFAPSEKQALMLT